MEKNCEHKNPLQRDGYNQTQRFKKALEPSYAPLDDRSTEDLLQFAYRYAEQIKFFDLPANQEEGENNWQAFFEKINSQSIEEIENASNNDPHFTLFLCFLKLFKFAQNQLNDLTETHLDFYYKEVLQLQKKSETPDRVNLIFELAKNANEQMILAGTRFNAGKDEAGNPMEYVAAEDTILNKAQVELLRTIRRENNSIHFASVSNSEDGMGEEPIEDGNSWNAFGNLDLPISTPGLALASPILALKEGTRKIIINFTLSSLDDLESISNRIKNSFEIYASGEEDWLGPFALRRKSSIKKVAGSSNNYLMQLITVIPNEEEAIVPFESEVLTGEFNSTAPMLRILLNNSDVYTMLENSNLTSLKIETLVTGVNSLLLENDFGKLDPSKPFMPFGAAPKKNANFYLGSQEAFTKKLNSFKLKMRWQNLPYSFGSHYNKYKNPLKDIQNKDFKGKIQILSGNNWNKTFDFDWFNKSLSNPEKNVFIDFMANDEEQVDDKKQGFRLSPKSKKAKPRYRQSHLRLIKSRETVRFFEDGAERKKLVRKRTRRNTWIRNKKRKRGKRRKFKLSTQTKDGFIRLVLRQDFGHSQFTSLYAVAIAKKVENDKIGLPKEPYTPTLESIFLDYHATTDDVKLNATVADKTSFEDREIQLFHLHPFGHSEEHPYLKKEIPFLNNSSSKNNNNTITIFPKREFEGEFYVGLKNIEPNQSLSLLLQLDEGSANPELEKQDIEWSVLVHNHWKPLDENHLLADHTNQLLTSGIVKLILPKEATDDNTLLDEDHYWLRLAIKEKTDAVANFIGVHGQSLQVVFENKNNDPLHLATALPSETISKMVNRLPSVKKVIQPYDSFGGNTQESSSQFYTRVSERLRHKNRAVSIWDYEHLVLENFPEIYKVKCVNHTSSTNEFSPGNVYVIIIPNLKNRNTSNFLKPKVSSNTLSEIENFLNKKSSMFTKVVAQNPDYEEVVLELDVAFHKTLEFGFYKKQLNEDIKKFLTPWAFDEGREIHFGGQIHKSVLIHFIDGLEYVDFVTNFYMYHKDENGIKSNKLEIVETSTSRAILVSTESHTINQTQANSVCL
ncbi:MAG: baseplate J/gp47 family protein [Saprospiraceae bacterium]